MKKLTFIAKSFYAHIVCKHLQWKQFFSNHHTTVALWGLPFSSGNNVGKCSGFNRNKLLIFWNINSHASWHVIVVRENRFSSMQTLQLNMLKISLMLVKICHKNLRSAPGIYLHHLQCLSDTKCLLIWPQMFLSHHTT